MYNADEWMSSHAALFSRRLPCPSNASAHPNADNREGGRRGGTLAFHLAVSSQLGRLPSFALHAGVGAGGGARQRALLATGFFLGVGVSQDSSHGCDQVPSHLHVEVQPAAEQLHHITTRLPKALEEGRGRLQDYKKKRQGLALRQHRLATMSDQSMHASWVVCNCNNVRCNCCELRSRFHPSVSHKVVVNLIFECLLQP